MDAKECADCFRNDPGFKRQFELLLKKYKSHNGAGIICIPDATEAECDAARSIIGKPFSPPLKYKVAEFRAALQESRFAGCSLKELLEAYFGIELHTSREIKIMAQAQVDDLFNQVAGDVHEPVCLRWLKVMRETKGYGYSLLVQALRQDTEEASKALLNACRGVEYLQINMRESLRLAVWSAAVTSDPHAFDLNTLTGKLLRHLLDFRRETGAITGERQQESLSCPEIIMDSISSSVSQVGLQLFEEHGEHPAFHAFRLRSEICTVTLANLLLLKQAKSISGNVYLVENQMVFSQLCDRAEIFHSPLICTSGQLQTAVWLLLDMLSASGCTMHYSGDFDPEGLSIADRLLARYPENVQMWHFSSNDYELARSEVILPEDRLNTLQNIQHKYFRDIIRQMKISRYAGYQELLLPVLLDDLTRVQ